MSQETKELAAVLDEMREEGVVYPFHEEVAEQAKLRYGRNSIVERSIKLQSAESNVTHRQPSISIYHARETAWMIGDDLDKAYSMRDDAVGEVVTRLVRATEYVIGFYDIEELTDQSVRYMGGPVAREKYADDPKVEV